MRVNELKKAKPRDEQAIAAAEEKGQLLTREAREASARLGFWLVLIATATPLLAAGSILMTVDPLSVLFWTAAMLAAWRAIRQDSTQHWLWSGFWLALGAMSKFTALVQPLCWAIFFWL